MNHSFIHSFQKWQAHIIYDELPSESFKFVNFIKKNTKPNEVIFTAPLKENYTRTITSTNPYRNNLVDYSLLGYAMYIKSDNLITTHIKEYLDLYNINLESIDYGECSPLKMFLSNSRCLRRKFEFQAANKIYDWRDNKNKFIAYNKTFQFLLIKKKNLCINDIVSNEFNELALVKFDNIEWSSGCKKLTY